MGVIRYPEAEAEILRNGVERRLGYTDHLMMAIVDFSNGPQAHPDPQHSHPHEQITYVAEGEIFFILDGVPTRLAAGDLVLVPANQPHTIQLLTEQVRLLDCFTPVREDFLKPDQQK